MIRNGKGYPDPTQEKALYRNERRQSSGQAALKGAMSKAQGAIFERLITTACNKYNTEGKAVIEKTPEPMRVIKNMGAGKFLSCFEEKAQPDFKGVMAGGLMIAFEAKHTDKDLIGQERVNEVQTKKLTQYEQSGAMCFVLVSIKMKRFFMVPWMVWNDMKRIYGRKHMKLEDLEFYEVKIKGGYLRFLEGMDEVATRTRKLLQDI